MATMKVLNAIRARCRPSYVVALQRRLPVIAATRYRKAARLDLELLLEAASPFDGVAYRVPITTRARLLMVTRELEPNADLEATCRYIAAIVADEPIPTLQDLVLRTDSLELIKCFRRWVPTCDRQRMSEMIRVAEVMLE